jgi:hypothetical protein
MRKNHMTSMMNDDYMLERVKKNLTPKSRDLMTKD